MIRKYGSRFALNIGYAFSVLAFLMVIVSPYSSALAVIGNILLGVSLLKVPAYADELSKDVPTSEQARIQSSKDINTFWINTDFICLAYNATFLVAAGVGAILYGNFYRKLGAQMAYLLFVAALVFTSLAWLVLYWAGKKYPVSQNNKKGTLNERLVDLDPAYEYSSTTTLPKNPW
jgi:hypothetical protein